MSLFWWLKNFFNFHWICNSTLKLYKYKRKSPKRILFCTYYIKTCRCAGVFSGVRTIWVCLCPLKSDCPCCPCMSAGVSRCPWVRIRLVFFSNFFKQIQNQQKAGIQDCILSLCIQIVFKNFVNSRIVAHNNNMAIKTAKFSQISQFLNFWNIY